MSAKKNNHTLLKVTMAAAGIGAAVAYGKARAAEKKKGSLAGAAYLIRDAGWEGKRIHILEGMPILGGSNDGSGTPAEGFVCRGGMMLNE